MNTSAAAIAAADLDTRRDYYRRLTEAQLDAWSITQGWFYWSYKLQVDGAGLDGWDLGKAVSLGYFPAGHLEAKANPTPCQHYTSP